MDRPYRDPDRLEGKYHGGGLTQREIAEECGVVTSTIRRWMNRLSIDTREVKGEHHGMYGKERSEEVIQRISVKLKGRTVSEETRQRISDAQRGKTIPPEVREKISRSLTGLKRPLETREKMSRSTAGKNNPNWQGGYECRYGEGWAPARDRGRERDEVCQTCVVKMVQTPSYPFTTSFQSESIARLKIDRFGTRIGSITSFSSVTDVTGRPSMG